MINKKFFSTAGIVESSASTSNFVYTPPTGFVGPGGTFSTVASDLNNFTLSNNNLTASQRTSGNVGGDYAYSSVNLTSGGGKYYAEFTLGNNGPFGDDWFLGVIQHGLGASFIYYDGAIMRTSIGKVNSGYEFFANYSSNPSSSKNSIISVYYNHSTRQVGFYVNGTDHGYVGNALDSGMTDVRFVVFGNANSSSDLYYDAAFE